VACSSFKKIKDQKKKVGGNGGSSGGFKDQLVRFRGEETVQIEEKDCVPKGEGRVKAKPGKERTFTWGGGGEKLTW